MIGTLLGERYFLENEIARGGRGIVYKAQDSLLKRQVAVKVLVKQDQDGQHFAMECERLLREAQSVARLNHPNIVTLYDAGQAGGSPFIVMEFIEGQALVSGQVYPFDQILSIARQVASALGHAHAQRIIHRDLKPENILITPDGLVKLTDFGLARSLAASRLTREGTLLGTVFYLAPEQALGREVDQRTDLYSLGVVLYEMTTGRLPFSGKDPLAVISQHIHAPVVPPRAYAPNLPTRLEALILQLMSKLPEERPASAREVLLRLEMLESAPDEVIETGELHLLDRIVRGRLIGRSKELRELITRWSRAAHGESSVVEILGEAGIGKTRLARELSIQVQIMGGRLLQGSCYAEAGPPYAPIAQVIQTAADLVGLERLSELSSLVLSDLITLHPSLSAHFPHVPKNPPLDPQAEQQRMYESFADLIQMISETAPLLFTLEDVHWADPGALFLVRHLARRAAKQHMQLLILLTYRQAELEDKRALSDLLLELNRERLLFSVQLSRLSVMECGEMLSAMFAEEISPDFLNSIYQETDGNPFFIEEVCKALIEDGQLTRLEGGWQRPSIEEMRIPNSLRVVIQSRLKRLPELTQHILLQAAIIGREFDFETLQKASGTAEEDLLQALISAEKAQVINEARRKGSPQIVFSFAHALIPVVFREISGTLSCRRIHRQVAEAVMVLRPDDYEVLAYHLTEGGDLDGSRKFHLLAGDRARQLVALEDAAAHYRAALEIWPVNDQAGKAAALQKLGECLWLSSGPGSALNTFETSYQLYNQEGERIRAGDMQRIIGRMHWELANRKSALEHYQRALQILEAEPESVELARVISSLSQMDMLASQFDGAIQWGERALEMAERLGAEDVVIHSLNNIGSARCHVHAYDQQRGLKMLQESLQKSLTNGLPHDVGRAYLNLGEMLVSLGQSLKAARVFEDAYSYFKRIHARAYEELFLIKGVELAWQMGRWSESLERWSLYNELTQGVFALWIRTCSARINNDLGHAGAACQELEANLPQALRSDEAQTTVPYLAQLARSYAVLGETIKAVGIMRECLERLDKDPYFFWGLEKPILFACQWYSERTEPEFGEEACACLARLERISQQMQTPSTIASLAEGRGSVYLAQADYQQAVEQLQAAVGGWVTLDQPLDLARAFYYLGKAQDKAGLISDSQDSFKQGTLLLSKLGSQIHDPDQKASFKNSLLTRRLEQAGLF
jgi:eukaryotic-like serine/threonine-protein kinase